MTQETINGKITFIHHEKGYATIEYNKEGKKKSINGNIDEKEQQRLKAAKLIKKIHHYNIGDEIRFIITLSPRGDKQVASQIEYLFNNALDNLITKAAIENRFVGYLKKVEEGYFVKETGSYISFPLILAPWEIEPREHLLNEPVFFKLDNLEKPGHLTASLFKSDYIPEFSTVLLHYKKKQPINASVIKVTPHGIYVNILSKKIQAKIPLSKKDITPDTPQIVVGSNIMVKVTYIGGPKIIVEEA